MTANKMIASRVQDQSPRQDVLTGLRAPGLLAKRPIIGLLLAIFGSLAFAALTYNLLAQGPLLEWDRALANTLPAIGLRSPAFVKDLMDIGFYMGKEVTMVVGVLLGLYFIYKRFWQELAMATIGWIGGTALFNLLSTIIGRARPPTMKGKEGTECRSTETKNLLKRLSMRPARQRGPRAHRRPSATIGPRCSGWRWSWSRLLSPD